MPRFATKKWIEVYDEPEKNYNTNKEIRMMTSKLRSDICHYSSAYIVVKGTITAEGDNNANKRNKNLAFKNDAPFIDCISKFNGIKTDNAEDLDVAISMYNLLEYSNNYRKTTGTLWNYYRDEPSNPLSSNSGSFKYKRSIKGKTPENNDSLTNVNVVIPLKYLSNFWKSLDIPLINCEVVQDKNLDKKLCIS